MNILPICYAQRVKVLEYTILGYSVLTLPLAVSYLSKTAIYFVGVVMYPSRTQ